MAGLSTAYFSKKGMSGTAMLKEARELGARYLELEYRISSEAFEDILKAPAEIRLPVSSLHNYCPRPDFVDEKDADGDYFRLSALDEDEWQKALTYTTYTLEAADRAGASAVVLHLGDSGADRRKSEYLEIADSQEIETDKGRRFLSDIAAERKANSGIHLDRVKKALERLIPVAERYGIRLGLENRYYITQTPDFHETGVLLDNFKGAPVGMWLDWGHAEVQKLFGYQGIDSYLDAYGENLVGFHIHDVTGRRDHRPPGMGDVDFSHYQDWIRKSPINILEVKSIFHPDEMKRGFAILHSIEDDPDG